MVDMAVSGPKLATFVKRLTCKWSAPLCIKAKRRERSPNRRQCEYICQSDSLASFWGRGSQVRTARSLEPQPLSSNQSVSQVGQSVTQDAHECKCQCCDKLSYRSGVPVPAIQPAIDCTVQVQWKIVCVARIWLTIKTPSIKASANSSPSPLRILHSTPAFHWSLIGDRWSVINDRWSAIADLIYARFVCLAVPSRAICKSKSHHWQQLHLTMPWGLSIYRSADLPISRSLTALRINWPQSRDREAGWLGLATCLDLRQSLELELELPSPVSCPACCNPK